MAQVRLRPAAHVALAAAVLAGLAACGDARTAAAPDPLPVLAADATVPATPGAPRACTGPATALAPSTVVPIVENATPALPVAVADARGKTVNVASAERVLALGGSGTLATTVHALGLGKRLVGRDNATLLPELIDLPTVTSGAHELSAEAILNLRPDLVLLDPQVGPPETIGQLESSGIAVLAIAGEPRAAAIGAQIGQVAAAFGLADLGAKLAQRVDAELAAVRRRVAALVPADSAQRLRMAFLYLRGSSGTYVWLGRDSGADELIATLNGVDVAAEAGIPSRTPLNAEAVVAVAPQLLLVMTAGLQSVGGVEGLKKVVGIAETEVARTGCVVDVPDHLVLAFGPMYPAVLDALVAAVYERAAPA
ncbi:MAG: heme/hemin ABC transporter substrate-binding protein [Sporichthyaceae bacterium]